MKIGSAPALDRGLTLLEVVARSPGPVGFNALAKSIGVSNATASRLLSILLVRGYLERDTETRRYRLGPQLAHLRDPAAAFAEAFRREAQPILVALSEASGNTALALRWTGDCVEWAAKAMHPAAIPMETVGHVSYNLSLTPWGWLTYDSLDEAAQARMRAFMPEPEAFLAKWPRLRKRLAADGCAHDADPEGLPHVRRLAVPVRGAEGRFLGALALGGNPLTLPPERVPELAELLKRHANALSSQLRRA